MTKTTEILSLPICATIQSKSMIGKFAEIANTSPHLLPTAKIGRLGDKLYALDNYNMIQGCKDADLNEIPSIITQYDSMQDLVLAHFHESINEEPLNPLSIFDVIDFLKDRGLDEGQIASNLWISNTQYEKLVLIEKSQSRQALKELKDIVDSLSERNIVPSMLQVPVYVIVKICRMTDTKEQMELVSKIGIMVSSIPDAKFAWPTPEQIDTLGLLVKDYERSVDTEQEEPQPTQSKAQSRTFDSITDLQQFLKKFKEKQGIRITLTWRYD